MGMAGNNDPATQRDIASLKDWIEAKFDTVGTTLTGMQRALSVAEREREKKDAELNDVRLRFIPREVFDAYKEDQESRRRANLYAFAVLALTVIGLVIQALGRG